MEAAASLWEWEEGSFQEKVVFYSLHPLNYFDIGFLIHLLYYHLFQPNFCGYLKIHAYQTFQYGLQLYLGLFLPKMHLNDHLDDQNVCPFFKHCFWPSL